MRLQDLPLLDEGFDASAREAVAAKPVRNWIAVALALICAPGLGWQTMGAWLLVCLAFEGLTAWYNRRHPYPEKATPKQRGAFIVAMLFSNGLWTVPSILMWLSGEPALQIAAVVQWLANIYYTQVFARKSRLFAMVSLAPQILTLTGFVLFASPFHGWEAVTPIAIILLAAFNGGLGLMGAVIHHEKLVAALAARDASDRAAETARLETEASERRFRMAAAMVKMQVWEVAVGKGAPSEAMEAVRNRIHPDDKEMVRVAWVKTFAEGAPYHMVHRLASDPVQWVESVAELIPGADGQPARIVGALRNIDAEKTAEAELVAAKDAAEAANHAKSVFLATMSHEIRTPLNGVLGMAQAMSAGELGAEQRARLDVIRASGESLLAILNDVLDLSKIEAGKVELEEVEFDVATLVRAAQEPFAPIAEQKHLVLAHVISNEARGRYTGDPTRIRQVLSNLVSNAIKFTQQGSVTVRAERTHDGLILSVEDTGIGIPADRRAALFENFVQVDASTTRKFGGTGLGLAISRQLVRLMGGDIEVESQPGQGSTFRVRLPLAWAGPELEADAAPGAAASPLDAPALKILAAEDNAVNQLVLTTLLAQFGWSLTMVDNGQLAVEAWEREPFDLVLMDMQMPVMDGQAAINLIRAAEARQGRPRTPVIALTANALSHQVAEYTAGGFDAVVAKPIELPVLVETILAVVDPEPARLAQAG